MPNAVANFTNAFARYKAATAAPLGQLPVQQPVQQLNPYASTYQPAANRPVAAGAAGPISATLASLRGLVKDKDYDEFVQQKAPAIDQALPMLLGLVGLIKGQSDQPKVAQAPQQPSFATPGVVSTQGAGQPEWATQVSQGIQGVAGLVNLIGGLFK